MFQLLLVRRLAPWMLLTAVVALGGARPAAAAADTTPPVLAVPQDFSYQLKQADASVRMTYSVGVQDETDAHPKTSCLPRSGSRFPVGMTKVTCTARDASGNRARASFRITVKAAARTERQVKPAARRATPRLSARAYRRTARGTELLGVKVTRLARGAEVTVTCDPRCPGALGTPSRHIASASSLSLAGLFRGLHLKPGMKVRVATAGMSSRILIRGNRAPLVIR